MSKPYIFLIAYNCGEIAKKCVETYLKHHSDTLHIFGTYKDFKKTGIYPSGVEYNELSGEVELKENYKHGHMGTAYVFSKVILEHSNSNHIIHIDSDIVFRQESISYLKEKLNEGYDIVGPRRCYKNNLNGRKDLSELRDVTQTYFFGFNKDKISAYDFNTLKMMVVGYQNPLKHPILDFFDPVAFDILKNGGKISYLDPDRFGCQFEDGSKKNKYTELNEYMDFGHNLMHFAGVGSGANFCSNGHLNIPEGYATWAKGRYALYSSVFEDKNIVGVPYDVEKVKLIKTILENDKHIL